MIGKEWGGLDSSVQSLARAGGRDTLLSDFRAIAEATTPEGERRYAETPTLQWLARFIVGATGGPHKDIPLFELCHLIRALDCCGAGSSDQRSLFFLGLGRAMPSLFKAYFLDQSAQGPLTVSEEEVVINYGDQVFAIRYGRMPMLAALFEFLAGLDSFAFFAEFSTILDDMLAEPPSIAAAQAASNKLSSHLRLYRKEHLASAESDGKFTTVHSFLSERSEENHLKIDDAAILDFWTLHNRGNDYRGYRTVFDLFIKFMQSLDEAQARGNATDAARLGVDWEAGEIDPTLDDTQDTTGEWRSPLPLFDEPPLLDVKFFKKSGERKPLEPLMVFGPKASALPLAFLRYEIFGQIQAGITNDLQVGRGRDSITKRITCDAAEPYADRKKLYQTLRDHLRQLQQAAFYVLSETRDETSNVVAFPGTEVVPEEVDLDALNEEAAKAFKKLTRKGFDEQTLDDPEKAQAFRLAAGALITMSGQLESYLKKLEAMDLATSFAADQKTFSGQFRAIYGEAS